MSPILYAKFGAMEEKVTASQKISQINKLACCGSWKKLLKIKMDLGDFCQQHFGDNRLHGIIN